MSTPLDRIKGRAAGRKQTTDASLPAEVAEYTPFPVGCLPNRVQPFVNAVAASTNTDPAYTGLPLLSLLGAMVGTARLASPKKGWRVYPAVYAMSVGASASGKSPPLAALNEAIAPLIEDADHTNQIERATWENEKAMHIADKSKRGTPPTARTSAPPPPCGRRYNRSPGGHPGGQPTRGVDGRGRTGRVARQLHQVQGRPG